MGNAKTAAIAAARARLATKMNPQLAAILGETGALTDAIRAKRGTLTGITCNAGLFAVEETTTVGRKSTTVRHTGWQSYAECVQYMREMAA